MELKSYVLALQVLFTYILDVVVSEGVECLEGFNSDNLLCSSCDKLQQFNLDALSSSCYECCQEERSTDAVKKYSRARLEVCGWKVGAYPQVQAFIKSERPDAFPGLEIKYKRGADPVIKVLNDSGELVESLAIDKWNTDAIVEFLKEHLETNEI